MIGSSFGNYKILEKLNRAGTIGVYKAVDRLLDRRVLVKILNREMAAEIADGFQREAATLAKLAHACVPTLHSLSEIGDELFMIAEFADGETLDRILLREKRLSIEKAFAVFASVFDCFEYAHKTGIAHGDFGSSDVMLTDAGTVKILNFGAAQTSTPANNTDKRGDVQALAVTLYETLTGESPFGAEKQPSANISDALAAIIFRVISAASNEDSASVSEFRKTLEAAGFRVSGEKNIASSPSKTVVEEARKATEKTSETASDERVLPVGAASFMRDENPIFDQKFNRRLRLPSESENLVEANAATKKPAQKRYKIAGAAIVLIFVLHSIWQFSFIQTENLRTAEASLPANAPITPPLEIKEIETTAAPPKTAPVVAVKPDYAAKNAGALRSAKSVQTAIYRKVEPSPAPKKKTNGESKAERLRRAEKMLTGF